MNNKALINGILNIEKAIKELDKSKEYTCYDICEMIGWEKTLETARRVAPKFAPLGWQAGRKKRWRNNVAKLRHYYWPQQNHQNKIPTQTPLPTAVAMTRREFRGLIAEIDEIDRRFPDWPDKIAKLLDIKIDEDQPMPADTEAPTPPYEVRWWMDLLERVDTTRGWTIDQITRAGKAVPTKENRIAIARALREAEWIKQYQMIDGKRTAEYWCY